MKPFLEVRNITKQYASHTALDDVSLTVNEQTVFGLLGPNGAGKTSLIRIINQITAPDKGEVFLNGEKLSPHHVSMIGYLPEERGLYKKMSVGEQSLYLARLKGLSRKDALLKLKFWFEKFDIAPWWDKKVEELSKGMAQKVQFITTVLHEPKLLILDEPFSGFDPINANLLKEEILSLKSKGATIIFSTHNMASVEEICDDIALIHRSKKILDGSVSSVRNQFNQHEIMVEFSGNLIAFTNALWTGYELIEHKTERGIISAKVKLLGGNKTNDLLNTILPHVQIVSVQEHLPSMNEIFIRKVSEISKETNQNSISNE